MTLTRFFDLLYFYCQHSLKPLALPRQVNSGLFGCFLPCFSAVIKTNFRSLSSSDDAISPWHEEPSVFIKWSFTPWGAIVVWHDRNRRRKRRWHLICRWIIKKTDWSKWGQMHPFIHLSLTAGLASVIIHLFVLWLRNMDADILAPGLIRMSY